MVLAQTVLEHQRNSTVLFIEKRKISHSRLHAAAPALRKREGNFVACNFRSYEQFPA